MLHVLKHSAMHTLELIPILFVFYYLIELLEYKNIFNFENSKTLKGKASPVMGALVGSIPQCGFSVISSDLYSKRKISIGALIAVFISTSDEAIPLMLTSYKNIPALLLLIATKIILAIGIGYLTAFVYGKIFKSAKPEIQIHEHNEHHDEDDHHDHHEEHGEHHDEEHIHACCHHDLNDTGFDWKHPLIHCLKITLYIFIINFIFETIIHFVGTKNLTIFLESSSVFQPLLALLIGLIPNCASSIVLTELYLMGGLSFGAIITGLSVNAGLGFLVLLRENKNKKENLFVLAMMVIPSLIVGYALHFIPFNFIQF
ncbi:MAG: arsenic efflux protein [Clostridia bacterium]|nr:arsenic efflux protein [Clostridia bacterium]